MSSSWKRIRIFAGPTGIHSPEVVVVAPKTRKHDAIDGAARFASSLFMPNRNPQNGPESDGAGGAGNRLSASGTGGGGTNIVDATGGVDADADAAGAGSADDAAGGAEVTGAADEGAPDDAAGVGLGATRA